jgi:16S rRNA (cytidine1402-2'-O)-methyltransferase
VIPIPGPFAGAAAVSVSGLPTDRVYFVGFLPKRLAAQEKELEALGKIEATLVIYISPHDLARTLATIARGLGDRPAFLIREMTKAFESSYQGTLVSIAEQISTEKARGEYTLVIHGRSEEVDQDLPIDAVAYVEGLVEARNLLRKDAIRQAAAELGIPRRELYDLVTAERKQD